MTIMKPTRKLLFILCIVLVLGFIYYSAWKLHLHVWAPKTYKDPHLQPSVETKGTAVSDKALYPSVMTKERTDADAEVEKVLSVGRGVGPVYDKQGFLLKLDEELPPELKLKYGNLSKGACKPGYVAAKMAAIYPKFVKLAPMFLDQNYKRLGKINNYLPPFGVKTQDSIIDVILTATKKYGLDKYLESLKCKRCIVVGNGGVLANKSLGSHIDGYDVVVRLNQAPVSGYEKDVGSKTTLRITYPEGAFQKPKHYENHSLFVLSAFKPQDFKWLRQMVFKEKLGKPVAPINAPAADWGSIYGRPETRLHPEPQAFICPCVIHCPYGNYRGKGKKKPHL
ncbi:ST3 beta-galactoside alpha-2,3-sialyltransferase 3b isoform X5 [Scleropages formosus]|uniref:ST3 beta-galactoside alpha-2,3-sialyltransferase 3b isoform X5 n=1 Tax=Scleropages formosus TaxID=113540 RepID=UPI000878F105|nr:CMP-N-acetylneuraminate-beta-1,4-galactoside alpha-2,3-sialyltransferase isoform X5 [Scleropages formosus]